mmetsp:Transcript_49238/g.115769  ORF Transcript_49238/g.115769 Transcript_49238/m.115769 type:complete len:262 (-) Transcript_49238:2-787(-)
MAHPRAGHNLDAAAAAPSPQGHLDVLAAPLSHVGVVGSHVLPIVLPEGEDPTGEGWRGVGVRVDVRLVPGFDERFPAEGEAPVEATDMMVRRQVAVEVFLWNDVQDGHHQCLVIFRQAELLQERFQPLLHNDAMRLHENEDRTRNHGGADDLGTDQALPYFVAVHSDLRMQCPEFVVMLPLRGVAIIDEQDLVDKLEGTVCQERANRGFDLNPGLVQVWNDQGGPRKLAEGKLPLAGGVPHLPGRGKRWIGASEGSLLRQL